MPNDFNPGRLLNAQDVERLGDAVAGTYIFPTSAGGAVTPSSGLTVAVAAIAASTVTIDGTLETTAYAGGTVTADAADSLPRRDLVYYDQTGAVGIAKGTPAAVTATTGPALPILTADQIAVAELYVDVDAVSIEAGDITDRRQSVTEVEGPTTNYKTSTQVLSGTTTFADVSGADAATFAFAIAANEVWEVEYYIPFTFVGNGGAKFQLTGPGSPTAVTITGSATRGLTIADGSTAALAQLPFAAVAAFSTAFAQYAGTTSPNITTAQYSDAVGQTLVIARATIRNGANAGTVTLQAAQNTAANTTTLGLGTFMRAEKIS